MGLPLPGPWKLSAVLWYAGLITPEGRRRPRCVEFASLPVRLGVSRRGRLTATAGDVGPFALTAKGSPVFDTYEVNSTVSRPG